jgi:histidine triad (HIT) family protein
VAAKLAGQYGLKEGYRVVINCREQAGQTVPHLHMHLIGGRPMHWPPG